VLSYLFAVLLASSIFGLVIGFIPALICAFLLAFLSRKAALFGAASVWALAGAAVSTGVGSYLYSFRALDDTAGLASLSIAGIVTALAMHRLSILFSRQAAPNTG
jgi:prepilin signal peptidase PulO-like enzyme (type II secretory pathway)